MRNAPKIGDVTAKKIRRRSAYTVRNTWALGLHDDNYAGRGKGAHTIKTM